MPLSAYRLLACGLFLAVHARSLKPYLQDPEVRWFIGVCLDSVFSIGLYIWKAGIYPDLDMALRHAAFNVISIATTTDYASVDLALWSIFAPLWMLFLSSFATSAGSTGGGIKMMRAMHPSAVVLVLTGLDVVTALTAIVASINNTAPGRGRRRPCHHLCGTGGFPEVDLHFCNAARTPGTF